jgi:hypothetical protein
MPIFSTACDPKAQEKFIQWIDENPNGFFINRKSSNDMMSHRGKCSHQKPYNWAHQTGNLKACSADRVKLEHWAEIEGVIELKLCGDCF